MNREAAEESPAALIRRAMQYQYVEADITSKLAALRKSAGSWRDRDFTGAAYIDALRGDLNERLARLGLE